MPGNEKLAGLTAPPTTPGVWYGVYGNAENLAYSPYNSSDPDAFVGVQISESSSLAVRAETGWRGRVPTVFGRSGVITRLLIDGYNTHMIRDANGVATAEHLASMAKIEQRKTASVLEGPFAWTLAGDTHFVDLAGDDSTASDLYAGRCVGDNLSGVVPTFEKHSGTSWRLAERCETAIVPVNDARQAQTGSPVPGANGTVAAISKGDSWLFPASAVRSLSVVTAPPKHFADFRVWGFWTGPNVTEAGLVCASRSNTSYTTYNVPSFTAITTIRATKVALVPWTSRGSANINDSRAFSFDIGRPSNAAGDLRLHAILFEYR